jgi:dienelactone hydrolase
MKVPTLMHLAEKDTWTPIKYCDNIDGNVIKMVHPDSVHAFDIRVPYRVYMGEVLEYNERADRLAREATHRFLKEFLQ